MRRPDAGLYDSLMLADRIEITGVAAHGIHGVYPDEALEAQAFVVDAVLWTDFATAAASDRLADTVDYVAASALVQHVVESSRALLVERLVEELCAALLDNPLVHTAQVTVHKPRAARDAHGTDVSVTCTRTR